MSYLETTISIDLEQLIIIYNRVNGDKNEFMHTVDDLIVKHIKNDDIFLQTQFAVEKLNKIDDTINLVSLIKFCRTGKFLDE